MTEPMPGAASHDASAPQRVASSESLVDTVASFDAESASNEATAFARLYGEPLFKLPTDLYIPPDALEVILDAFEGPLDLLLYLIRKQNFNILDIPMAELTRQYLGYVEQIRRHNLELAGDYLLMAAMLIDIKSKMLLPRRQDLSSDEVEDPRAELVRRLLQYERMKQAALRLNDLPQAGREFLLVRAAIQVSQERRFPDVSTNDLLAAWSEVLKRARLTRHHRITREPLSVREHMTIILRKLRGRQFFEFTELFYDPSQPDMTVPLLVVHFLALLELVRESLVELTQVEAFAPIYVRLGFRQAEAM